MKSTLLLFICFFSLHFTNAQRPFVTTWDTRNIGVSDNTHIIFYATGNNFQISWVNMSNASDTGNVVGVNGADTISFPTPGIYKVYISPGNGSFSAITQSKDYTVNHDDANRLLSIEQWGDINWSTFNTAFANCQNMIMNATDKPNLGNMSDMFAAFFLCRSLITNTAMSKWDVSNITNMSQMFAGAIGFNQSISKWDVSNVTNMNSMFSGAISFNQSIGNWDVSKVTDMYGMFSFANSFNKPIDSWNVSNVTNMSNMFVQTGNFNQPISSWDVGNVTNMNAIFGQAASFNQPIGNWDVSNVTDMTDMFDEASNFNQPIGNWNVSNVTNMAGMFGYASNFNQPIGNWNVSNVTNMAGMFEYASSFNQPIGNWDVRNVKNMNGMFNEANNFNQPIGNWDVSKVTLMEIMFFNASNFNQPIGNWNVSNVTSMNSMFWRASNFNQFIGNWNVSKVINMGEMFWYASNFNQPIGNWDVSNVQDMPFMFYNAKSFNQSLGSWKLNSLHGLYFTLDGMLDSCGMDCTNYSQTLTGWAANPALQKDQFLGAANLTYDSAFAQAAHDSLTDIKGWTIKGDISGHCSVLPVSLLSFTATKQQQSVLLNWQTANEINNNYFSIERSNNNKNFGEINKLQSTNNSSKINAYTTIDQKPLQGWNYYRLKQVDKDGKFSYSSIASVLFNDNILITVYPNPANNFVYVDGLKQNIQANILITDAKGKTVLTTETIQPSTKLNIQNLSSGIYYISITQDGKTVNQKFIKQ